jgi:large subunit ribosomal protein L29
MKKNTFLKDIQGLPMADLRAKAKTMAEELMKLRFRGASTPLEQSHRLKELRRNLARIQTLMTRQTNASLKDTVKG